MLIFFYLEQNLFLKKHNDELFFTKKKIYIFFIKRKKTGNSYHATE